MSFKNFFARSIRGWLPEEPKMPKSRLKRYQVPLAVFVAATTIFSLFSSSFFVSNQTAAIAASPLAVSGFINTSFVELGGVSETPNNEFILVLSNGDYVSSDALKLTLFIDKSSGARCTVTFTVECDDYSGHAQVTGYIINGNLLIDSKRSLFMINPEVTSGNLLFSKSSGWRLSSSVAHKTRRFSALDRYSDNSVSVSSNLHRTEKGWPVKLDLGYDHNSGLLIYSGHSISDVLLEQVGIDNLCGPPLKQKSLATHYESGLGKPTPSSLRYVPCFLLSSLVSLAVVVVYLLYRRRKRRQVGAHSILEYHDNFGQSCEVGD